LRIERSAVGNGFNRLAQVYQISSNRISLEVHAGRGRLETGRMEFRLLDEASLRFEVVQLRRDLLTDDGFEVIECPDRFR
jgi:hypothetical protein